MQKLLLLLAMCSACTVTNKLMAQKTAANETVKDCDGNIYHTVTIGTQVWMVENLKTTKYNDCTPIPNIKDATELGKQTTGAYCDYKNEPKNSAVYGRLYNWYTIANKTGIAPKGWHVPSLDEWNILITYLGGTSAAGGKLKEAGLTHWPAPNKDADNSSGFTGLPAGNRARQSGDFYALGQYGYLWTATSANKEKDAYNFHLLLYSGAISEAASDGKANGFSIRCIKD
jgi:uncharacterized protein (TIGR02145 family)